MTTLSPRRAEPVDAPVRGTARRSFLEGVLAMLPWLAGVVPFGLTIGVTIAESSIDPLVGWATGPLIYAGSAQLIAIELLGRGAAPLVVIATVLAVNARLVVYSGAMASHWRNAGRGFRALSCYLLIDPSFAVGSDGYQRAPERHAGHAYYLGCATVLWVAWQFAIGAGILAGTAVPNAAFLALVVPLYLVAEIARVAVTRPAAIAAGVAAVVAVAGTSLPLHSGVVVAIVAGVAGARLAEVGEP